MEIVQLLLFLFKNSKDKSEFMQIISDEECEIEIQFENIF